MPPFSFGVNALKPKILDGNQVDLNLWRTNIFV